VSAKGVDVPQADKGASVTTGPCETVKLADDLAVHPFGSVKEYVMSCVQTPATAGSRTPLVTPVPVYVPPGGDPPPKVIGAEPEQTWFTVSDNEVLGNAFTVIDEVAEAEHPFASMYE